MLTQLKVNAKCHICLLLQLILSRFALPLQKFDTFFYFRTSCFFLEVSWEKAGWCEFLKFRISPRKLFGRWQPKTIATFIQYKKCAVWDSNSALFPQMMFNFISVLHLYDSGKVAHICWKTVGTTLFLSSYETVSFLRFQLRIICEISFLILTNIQLHSVFVFLYIQEGCETKYYVTLTFGLAELSKL